MAVKNYLETDHLTKEYLQPFQEGIMADYNGSKPVMTVRDDEFKIKVVDGQSGDTATSSMSIVGEGDAYSANTNDFGVPVMGKDGSGNAIIIPVPLPVTDNGDSITVDGTVSITGDVNVTASDLDIRTLDHATPGDSVKIGDGTNLLEVNTDGEAGTLKSEYATEATVGVNSETIKFFPVTNLATAWGKSLLIGARGAVKVRFGLSSNGTSITTVKGVYFQDPKENYDHNIEFLSLLGDGTAAIAVGVTNLDAATSDIYWNIQYREV
jgi:hypothetical protein